MNSTNQSEDILLTLVEIALQIGELKLHNINEKSTLKDLGIGEGPIGQVEFLDFQNRLERYYRIKFEQNEIPSDPVSAGQVTLGQIVELIQKKLALK